MIVNKQKVLVLIYVLTLKYIRLCIKLFFKYVVSNMLFDPDNPGNALFLEIEEIFNIGSTIYIISFGFNNLVLIFILKIIFVKYHHKIPIISF